MEILAALLFLIGLIMAGAENQNIIIQTILNLLGIVSFWISLYLATQMKRNNKPI